MKRKRRKAKRKKPDEELERLLDFFHRQRRDNIPILRGDYSKLH